MPPSAAIDLRDIHLAFGDISVLEGVSFSAAAGEFIAVVGPTGCGKSSILNLASGLLRATAGTVSVLGRELQGLNTDAAYMFQQDALLPWKTVVDNVMLGPILRGHDKRKAAGMAQDWIRRVGLKGFEDRYPTQLSGGQRKRAAMAQALIGGLPLLLMDEPFSALDVQTRALMENELLEIWQHLKATVLFVTHDIEEAIALADRVLVLSAGPGSRLIGDYPVTLPRPRDVTEARFLPGFSEIYQQVWRDLREEVLASYEQSRSRP